MCLAHKRETEGEIGVSLGINYDEASGGAAETFALPKLGALLGGEAECASCFAHVSADVEFEL